MVVVNGDALDSHAHEKLSEALSLANPDDGSRVTVYLVEAKDAGAARLNTRGLLPIADQFNYRKD